MTQTKIGKDVLDNTVSTEKITDGSVTTPNLNPNVFTDITGPQLSDTLDLSSKTLTFSAPQLTPQIPTAGQEENAFNVGLLGFKQAVSEGLTIFNLVDGVVDEFNDESGIDTPENSNATYDSSSDFYSNEAAATIPAPQEITSYTSGTGNFTAEPTITNVNVLVVGGGGSGGGTASDGTGGGGAGGLVYYPNYPVTGGASYAYVVGVGAPEQPTAGGPDPTYGYNGADSSFNAPGPVPLVGEGGGNGGSATISAAKLFGRPGGSAGGFGGKIPDAAGFLCSPSQVAAYYGADAIPGFACAQTAFPNLNPSGGATHLIGFSTQKANHPTGLTPSVLPVNSPGGFGSRGGVGSHATPQTPPDGHRDGGGGGGAGGAGDDNLPTEPQNQLNPGGPGLAYNIADGSTSVTYAAGGNSGPEGGGAAPGADGTANTGNGGTGSTTPSGTGGSGGSGIVIVKESISNVLSSSLTLISDTFTASSVPTKARIVVFAELPDGTSDFTVSATRDNSTFNSITLTDEGFQAGSSGIKIFTGSTPLTGSGSPQVALRWNVVGSSLTGTNKIHGVSLQWA